MRVSEEKIFAKRGTKKDDDSTKEYESTKEDQGSKKNLKEKLKKYRELLLAL